METWKILTITILSAIVLGCIIGALIGRHQVKRAQSGYKSILSIKERIIYFACFALGAGLILFGVFYSFPSSQNPDILDQGGMYDSKMIDGMDPNAALTMGNAEPGAENPDSQNSELEELSEDQTGESVEETGSDDDSGSADDESATNEATTPNPQARPAPAPRVFAGGQGGVVIVS